MLFNSIILSGYERAFNSPHGLFIVIHFRPFYCFFLLREPRLHFYWTVFYLFKSWTILLVILFFEISVYNWNKNDNLKKAQEIEKLYWVKDIALNRFSENKKKYSANYCE